MVRTMSPSSVRIVGSRLSATRRKAGTSPFEGEYHGSNPCPQLRKEVSSIVYGHRFRLPRLRVKGENTEVPVDEASPSSTGFDFVQLAWIHVPSLVQEVIKVLTL